jgi:hypothetical protein
VPNQGLQIELETRILLVKGRHQAESAEPRVDATKRQPKVLGEVHTGPRHASGIGGFFSLEQCRRLSRLCEKSNVRMPEFSTSCSLTPPMRPTQPIGAGDQSEMSQSMVDAPMID